MLRAGTARLSVRVICNTCGTGRDVPTSALRTACPNCGCTEWRPCTCLTCGQQSTCIETVRVSRKFVELLDAFIDSTSDPIAADVVRAALKLERASGRALSDRSHA